MLAGETLGLTQYGGKAWMWLNHAWGSWNKQMVSYHLLPHVHLLSSAGSDCRSASTAALLIILAHSAFDMQNTGGCMMLQPRSRTCKLTAIICIAIVYARLTPDTHNIIIIVLQCCSS